MSIVNFVLYVLLALSSAFLILLVLIQRGKGGGLAGAFGGAGGSSAFGTKAGDVFTKITIWTVMGWFLLNMLLVYRMNQRRESAFGPATRSSSMVPGKPEPAGKGKSSAAKSGAGAAKETPVPPPVTSDGLPPALPDIPREVSGAPVETPATSPAPSPAPATSPAPAQPKDELPSPFGPEGPGDVPSSKSASPKSL